MDGNNATRLVGRCGWGRRARRLAMATVVLSAGAGGALQATPRIGPEVQVSDRGHHPTVDLTAGGRVVVAWEENGIKMQGFADGAAVTPRVTVAAPGRRPAQPQLVVDPLGRITVVWRSGDPDMVGATPGGDGDASAIFLRRFAAQGTPLGNTVRVNDEVAGAQDRPFLAQAAGGRLAVAWQESGLAADPEAVDVRVRRFEATGRPLGSSQRMASRGIGPSAVAGVGATDAYLTVGWTDVVDRGACVEESGALARLDWAGNLLGGVYRAGDAACDGQGPRAVGVLGSELAGGLGFFASRKGTAVRFDPQTAEPRVPRFDVVPALACDADTCLRIAGVAGDARGRIAVVFESWWREASGSVWSWVDVQVFGKDGNAKTDRLRLFATGPAFEPLEPAVALADNGRLVVAWRRGDASGVRGIVYRLVEL